MPLQNDLPYLLQQFSLSYNRTVSETVESGADLLLQIRNSLLILSALSQLFLILLTVIIIIIIISDASCSQKSPDFRPNPA